MNTVKIASVRGQNTLVHLSCLLLFVFFASSCAKNEMIDFEKEPQNKIVEFQVSNSQQNLYGAIDHETNTITVYIPYYLSIEFILPKIKLDEGATLVDSLGEKIYMEDAEPLAIGENATYIVRSQDGKDRTYTVQQVYLPHNKELKVWYNSSQPDDESGITKPINNRFNLYGTFGSVSKIAKFVFKDKNTGREYDDFFSVHSVSPGNSFYTMEVDVSPDAIAGEYDVVMEYQGRTTNLNPITLTYQKPRVSSSLMSVSTGGVSAGDTIVFEATSGASYPINSRDQYAGVFLGVVKAYLMFEKGTVTVVAGTVPEEIYNKPLEMKIISADRRQIKAIFPDAPLGRFYKVSFYIDYDEQSGWGERVLSGTTLTFDILQK